MPYIDFNQLRELAPAAFKLYVYFRHYAEQTGQATLTMSLADLGHHGRLQHHALWKAPSQRHGHDGRLRQALHDLVTHGWIEQTGGRGRQPNSYRVVTPPLPADHPGL